MIKADALQVMDLLTVLANLFLHKSFLQSPNVQSSYFLNLHFRSGTSMVFHLLYVGLEYRIVYIVVYSADLQIRACVPIIYLQGTINRTVTS